MWSFVPLRFYSQPTYHPQDLHPFIQAPITMSLSATWTQLASSTRLQRSSQTLSVVQGKAWIFGGEVLPREPLDNQLDVVELQPTATDGGE